MADQTKTQPKRRGFHKVVAKDDDTNETQSDGRPPPKKDLDLKVSPGTKPSPATTSSAQTDSKPPPKASPITHKTETPKVETTQPPKVETTQPPKVETTQPPKVETTQPPKVETTQPPKVETTQPPKVETTQPPKVETTQPPKVETTQPPPNTVTEPASAVVRSKPEAVSVYDEDMNYNISGGQGIIFVNEKFSDAPKRNGATKDIQHLKEIYQRLQIECEYNIHKDTKASTMMSLVHDFSERVAQDPDCSVILVSISSHGEQGGKIMGTDGTCVDLSEVIDSFQRREELLGIPKVFVVQACRGTEAELQYSDHDYDEDVPPPQYATKSGDTIICYSTGEGYVSFRSSQSGSWFIRILHSCVMDTMYRNLHFVEIMTVCCRLAVAEAATNKSGESKKSVTETPSYCSTLTKFIRFRTEDK